MNQIFTEPTLLAADFHGIYIPARFAANYIKTGDFVVLGSSPWTDEDTAILVAGPHSDSGDYGYWEAWDDLLDHDLIGLDDITYKLYEDGDLWIIPPGYEWDDSAGWFAPEEVEG